MPWQVLKAKTLPELVQRSNELSTEIKELDSDMQMLVYENYNKFISATETIQDMKTKVDGMEGEMGRLSTAVSEITGCQKSRPQTIELAFSCAAAAAAAAALSLPPDSH